VIDLGNEPPLSVDGGSGVLLDRRRLSIQWFSGTILTGLCGAALMGGAVFTSLDGETTFASAPERVETALRGALTSIGDRLNVFRKTDRLPAITEPTVSRQILRIPSTTRVRDREVVRTRPYIRVSGNLSLTVSDLSANIPAYNPQKLLSDSASDDETPAAEPDAEVSFTTCDFSAAQTVRAKSPAAVCDLNALLAKVKPANELPLDDVIARVRDIAKDPKTDSPLLAPAASSSGSLKLSYAAEGSPNTDFGFAPRVVPENVTLLPKTTAPANGAVQPGPGMSPPSQLFVTGPTGSVTAGAGFPVTITAKDGYGFTATQDNDSVTLKTSEGSSFTVQLVNGVGSITIGMDKAGTNETVTASDGALGLSVTSLPFAVVGGTPVHLKVTGPSSAVAGVGFNLTITATDGFGNPANGTVTLTSSDKEQQASVPVSNGQAVDSIILNLPGKDTLTVAAVAATPVSTTLTVTPGGTTLSDITWNNSIPIPFNPTTDLNPTTGTFTLKNINFMSSGISNGAAFTYLAPPTEQFTVNNVDSDTTKLDLQTTFLQTGEGIVYSTNAPGGVQPLGGLTPGNTYYVYVAPSSQVQFYDNYTDAVNHNTPSIDLKPNSGAESATATLTPVGITGLSSGVNYYVTGVNTSKNTFQLAASPGGPALTHFTVPPHALGPYSINLEGTESDCYAIDAKTDEVVDLHTDPKNVGVRTLLGGPTNVTAISAAEEAVDGFYTPLVTALTADGHVWSCLPYANYGWLGYVPGAPPGSPGSYHWDDLGNDGGIGFTALSMAHDGNIYALTATGQVLETSYFANPAPNTTWTVLGSPTAGPVKAISAGLNGGLSNDEVFAIGSDGHLYVNQFGSGSSTSWVTVDSSQTFIQISANDNNTVYGLTSTGVIYQESEAVKNGNDFWSSLGLPTTSGGFSQISAGTDRTGKSVVFAVENANKEPFVYNAQGQWTKMDGNQPSEICGGNDGWYYDVTNPVVYQYNPNANKGQGAYAKLSSSQAVL